MTKFLVEVYVRFILADIIIIIMVVGCQKGKLKHSTRGSFFAQSLIKVFFRACFVLFNKFFLLVLQPCRFYSLFLLKVSIGGRTRSRCSQNERTNIDFNARNLFSRVGKFLNHIPPAYIYECAIRESGRIQSNTP